MPFLNPIVPQNNNRKGTVQGALREPYSATKLQQQEDYKKQKDLSAPQHFLGQQRFLITNNLWLALLRWDSVLFIFLVVSLLG